jgi:hypothetical protein
VFTSTAPRRRSSSFVVVDFAGPFECHTARPTGEEDHGVHAGAQPSIARERLVACRRIFGGWGPRI